MELSSSKEQRPRMTPGPPLLPEHRLYCFAVVSAGAAVLSLTAPALVSLGVASDGLGAAVLSAPIVVLSGVT